MLRLNEVDEQEQDREILGDVVEPVVHRATSLFAKQLGIFAISYAPTGRATCDFCKLQIVKGEPRFSHQWHLRKPHRYIHADCCVRLPRDQLEYSVATLAAASEVCDPRLVSVLHEKIKVMQSVGSLGGSGVSTSRASSSSGP